MAASDFLQELGLFEGMSRAQVDRIAAVAVERRYQAGEVIFAEFSRGDDMFLIKDGALLVQISTPAERDAAPPAEAARHTIARLMPGQYVGEQAMVDDAMRSATVVSEGESVLLSLACADVERLCAEDPRLGYLFMRNIAEELSFKLRNTGMAMRGELWSSAGQTPQAARDFGFDHPTEAES